MAGPIVIVCTVMTALSMFYVLDYSRVMNFETCLLFGSIASATDPVAVVALLKDLGASQKLATMIEGESLLNDGTAMVVFLVMLEFAEDKHLTASEIIGKFCRLALGGPLVGLIFGVILTTWLSYINKKPVLEANLIVCGAYLTFFVSELHAVHVSGILALVVLGLYMGVYGKARLTHESEHAIHSVWS